VQGPSGQQSDYKQKANPLQHNVGLRNNLDRSAPERAFIEALDMAAHPKISAPEVAPQDWNSLLNSAVSKMALGSSFRISGSSGRTRASHFWQ
jgi:hypothetical protein